MGKKRLHRDTKKVMGMMQKAFGTMGGVGIRTIDKLLWLYYFGSITKCAMPEVDEIMEQIGCCRNQAYKYRRALGYILSEEKLEQGRRNKEIIAGTERKTTQQKLERLYY